MSQRTSHPLVLPGLACALTVTVVAFGLTGCSAADQLGSLSEAKQIAASCPAGREIAGRVAIDIGGGRLSVAAEPGRMAPARAEVERVAVCGGWLRVDLFAGAAGATAAVYDGELHARGATENARLRRVPKMVDEVVQAITAQMPTAAATLPKEGKDIVAQLGLSSEFGRQLSPDGSRYVLEVVITTDGVQTTNPPLTDRGLTVASATQLANQVAAPNLSGASVRLTDVGKTPDRSLPTGYTDALKAFYSTVCEASKAASCTVVTDGAGR